MNNQIIHVSWQTVFKKSAVWTLLLFFVAIFQTTLFSRYRLFGVVPELVLPTVVAIAIFDKERTGIISGIAGGFIIDALGGVGLSISPLVYMLCGCLAALLSYSILRREFISWFSATAASLVAHSIFFVIVAKITVKTLDVSFGEIFGRLVIPQYFASLILSIPLFFCVRAIWLKFFDARDSVT